MEQTMTTLSALSRITSSSNSFQPMTDSSISTSPTGTEVEAAGDQLVELLAVVGDAAAGAAEGEAGPQHARQADAVRGSPGPRPAIGPRRCSARRCRCLSMACLNFSRSSALSMTSGVAPIISTSYLSRTPCAMQVHGGVEAGLAAEGRQQGVGPFALDDLGDDFPGDRLDVGAVGHLRVGHDGGRIGVDQDDGVAFFAQGLAGLGAAVVELARLADDDGAGADEQDLLEVGALWHGRRLRYARLAASFCERSARALAKARG